MLQLYPILNQFVEDDGPKWAKDFYSEVMAAKMDNMILQPLDDRVGAFNRWFLTQADISAAKPC